MLKHEDIPQTLSQSAAQVRVTPEELAAAITRLEAKKDDGQRNMEGTVAIGEVVQQLGLAVTPDEVLAEVQAGRKAQSRKRFSLRQLSLRQRLGLYFAVGTLVVGLDCAWARLYVPNGSDTNVSSTLILPYAISPNLTPSHIQVDPNLVVSDASGKLMMLSEVGDDAPVTCVFNGGSFQQANSDEPSRWTLIKHSGKVYVRGWMAKTSPKVLQEDGADVSASQNSVSVPVTLPIDGFKFFETPQNFPGVAFHAVDIHLDKHAYEKW